MKKLLISILCIMWVVILTGCDGWQPGTDTVIVKCRWEQGDKFDKKFCQKCSVSANGCWWEQTEAQRVKKHRGHKRHRRG